MKKIFNLIAVVMITLFMTSVVYAELASNEDASIHHNSPSASAGAAPTTSPKMSVGGGYSPSYTAPESPSTPSPSVKPGITKKYLTDKLRSFSEKFSGRQTAQENKLNAIEEKVGNIEKSLGGFASKSEVEKAKSEAKAAKDEAVAANTDSGTTYVVIAGVFVTLIIIIAIVALMIIVFFRRRSGEVSKKELEEAVAPIVTDIGEIKQGLASINANVTKNFESMGKKLDDMKRFNTDPIEVQAGGSKYIYHPPTADMELGFYTVLNVSPDCVENDPVKMYAYRQAKSRRTDAIHSVRGTMLKFSAGTLEPRTLALVEHLLSEGNDKIGKIEIAA